jgi:hypothetical protein
MNSHGCDYWVPAVVRKYLNQVYFKKYENFPWSTAQIKMQAQ